MKITQHIVVKGKVQRVFFRDYTKRQALQYELTGWVRNLPDGSVEALLQGNKDQLTKMIAWFQQGSPHSRVDSVSVEDQPSDKIYSAFEIRY